MLEVLWLAASYTKTLLPSSLAPLPPPPLVLSFAASSIQYFSTLLLLPFLLFLLLLLVPTSGALAQFRQVLWGTARLTGEPNMKLWL